MSPSTVVFGAFGVAFALLGLFMAAAARDSGFYVSGLILFVSFVLFLFKLLQHHFDGNDAGTSD
ncbi:hypothetical protein FK498_13770 [Elioraea sp. Yellowstone]|jgi:Mg2+ and Co2+ transporter CorA|uniref:hypothetical protein n=1 Tax=Elioraea sp. Yellowstone TaxID=2592070 RepID=UPI0011540323|nr:hypothetical protein [Elioraea sp. Yellowstone]TQF77216.1 hypothetical protein FK498_13770 [Elioraea sp. Yellowstone]